jgi:hypothetical protein
MAVDDQRAAVGFSVTLSGQLIAASMATLAVEGAYVWYALGSRLTLAGFTVFAALAAVLIAVSIFKAGKGITKARNAGFAGTWNLAEGKRDFNAQATLLLGALLMLAVMFSLSGQSKESALERRVEDLRVEIALVHKELEAQPVVREAQNKKMADQLADISREIQALRALLPKAKAPKR